VLQSDGRFVMAPSSYGQELSGEPCLPPLHPGRTHEQLVRKYWDSSRLIRFRKNIQSLMFHFFPLRYSTDRTRRPIKRLSPSPPLPLNSGSLFDNHIQISPLPLSRVLPKANLIWEISSPLRSLRNSERNVPPLSPPFLSEDQSRRDSN